MPGHVDALAVPCRFIYRVHTQADPEMLAPLCSLLLRESVFDDHVAAFEKELRLFGYAT